MGRGDLANLLALLSADERQRADRYRFDGDRERYVVGRAHLRSLLASLGAGPAADIRFAYGDQGKPWLPVRPELRFNLSHAGDVSLVAVARADVGVDLEPLVPRRRLDDVAERFFSPTERSALARLAADERPAAVLRCWCRKEAYLKARGEGLARPLDTFDVATDARPSGERSLLGATRPDAREAAAWDLRDVDVGPGYVAAVALRGRITRVRVVLDM